MSAKTPDDDDQHSKERDPSSAATSYFVALGFIALLVSILVIQYFTVASMDSELEDKSKAADHGEHTRLQQAQQEELKGKKTKVGMKRAMKDVVDEYGVRR